MQLNSGSTAPPPAAALPVHDPALAIDAASFSEALESLARVYQLQDPRQTCDYGITMTECYSLETLVREGPRTVNQVASALLLDKSTASRAIGGLVRKGYARRRPHPEDGRAIEARATPAGERLYERIRAGGRRLHRELLEEFSPDARQAATSLLKRVASAERACAAAGCQPCA